MVSAVSLLERTRIAHGTEQNVSQSCNSQDVFEFLQKQYNDEKIQTEDGKFEESGNQQYFQEFVNNLDRTISNNELEYANKQANITDAVELNILIERSLLDYELHFNDNKKTVFEVESLEKLLGEVTKQGNTTALALLRHYVELLKLSSVSDLSSKEGNLGNTSQLPGSFGNDLMMEELISTLLSIAVQKNITLPNADFEQLDSTEKRIKWFKECIFKVAGSEMGNLSDMDIKSLKRISMINEDANNGTQTALNDLQFAHKYLSNRYKEEVSQHGQYVSDMTKKYSQCEELLKKSNAELTRSTNELLRAEMKNTELQKKLESLSKDMHELQSQNDLLKVDQLGLLPITTLMSPPHTAASPTSYASERSVSGSSTNGDLPPSPSTPHSQVSVGILRAEFRKLVEQMQQRHDKELHTANEECRRLESLLRDRGDYR